MNEVFVILFMTWSGGRAYDCLSNYYFNSEEDARAYACKFVENSCTFSEFEIEKVMLFIN